MTTQTYAAAPRLSAELVTGLWVLALLDLTYGAWLIAVYRGAAVCEGLPCTVATLGNPVWVLTVSQVAAVLLVVLLPVYQAPVGRARLVGIALSTIGGAVALAGVLLLIAVVALVLAVAVAIFVYVADNF